jgi:hypothetical protein
MRRYSSLSTSLGINPTEKIPDVAYEPLTDDAMFEGIGEMELRRLEKALVLYYPRLR